MPAVSSVGAIAVDDVDVGTVGGGVPQPLEVAEVPIAVDRLEDERGPFVRPERTPVRLDDGQRVLSLEAAVEIEREEEEEALGKAERGSVRRRSLGRQLDPEREHVHRPVRLCRDRPPDEVASDPDLVHELERVVEPRREPGDLPPPDADRVAVAEELRARRRT